MIFKCKMCGGSLDIAEGVTVCECEYCGTKQTLPKLDGEKKANLYDRANHFRRNNDFDKAMGIYENILNEDNTDSEAYWSLVLCRYGIEYVEDPATRKRVPTVNRAQFTSIFDDDNYRSAIKYADTHQRTVYEEEANAINEIQKGILSISQKEEPFDVFICYKESDENGRRTPDSVLANDLYHQLTTEGFKVFFSRITLEDKLGTAYEPYIFAALNSAKVMVVLGTRPEYFNAVWVKNEWSRFLAIIKQSGGKKVLIPAYRDMDPYDLPEEFSHLQAQDMSKLGFMQDLIRGIKKITETAAPASAVREAVVVSGGGSDVAPLLKRAFMFLEDGDFTSADEYCEKVLDTDPENAEAYLGKLMAELKCRDRDSLKNLAEPFDGKNNYKKVLRFGDEQLKNKLIGDVEFIKNRNEQTRLNNIYNCALSKMNSAANENDYKTAADIFKSISGYLDSIKKAEECIERANATWKDKIYYTACNQQKNDTIASLEVAIHNFVSIQDWKNSGELLDKCRKRLAELEKEEIARREKEKQEEEKRKAEIQRKAEEAELAARKKKKTYTIISASAICVIAAIVVITSVIIPESKYNSAMKLYKKGQFDEAINAFNEVNYKNSKEMIDEAKYQKAMILFEDKKYLEAIDAFEEIKNNNSKAMAKESKYQYAVLKYNQGEYEESTPIFLALSDYKDSADMYILSNYNYGMSEFEKNNFDLASDIFFEMNYKNSDEMYMKSKYNNAELQINDGDYEKAYYILSGIEYNDSREKADKIFVKHLLNEKNVGDEISFGGYKWIILQQKTNKTQVISKDVFEKKEYNDEKHDVTWESCSLRKFLNDDFYNSFNEKEIKCIVENTNVTPDNPEYNTSGGNETTDKIYILSIDEVKELLKVNEQRIRENSWWLRSSGSTGLNAAYVNTSGEIICNGINVDSQKIGYRPVMWLSYKE